MRFTLSLVVSACCRDSFLRMEKVSINSKRKFNSLSDMNFELNFKSEGREVSCVCQSKDYLQEIKHSEEQPGG